MRLKSIGIAGLVLFAATAQASTYVGNGGNSGDIELTVTKLEIKKALQASHDEKTLCTCDERIGEHPLCELLQNLKNEQRQFCEDFIRQHTDDLLQVLDSPKLQIEWTHEPMDVNDGLGLRAAEAGTDAQQMKITINEERFIKMRSFERVFLLTHELGHFLTATEDAHPLIDQQKVGPFESKEGGKDLLNAVGAGVSVVAVETNITESYLSVIHRSRANSSHWFYLGLSSVQPFGDSSPWQVQNLTGATFGYRYQFNQHWGIFAEFRQVSANENSLSTVNVSEEQTAWSLGLAYRYFPSSDLLSIWGPSHFLLAAKVDELAGHLVVSDPYTSAEDRKSSLGMGIDVSYYLACQNGFWLFGTVGYNTHDFRYATDGISIHNNRGQVLTTLGVSYGFN